MICARIINNVYGINNNRLPSAQHNARNCLSDADADADASANANANTNANANAILDSRAGCCQSIVSNRRAFKLV